MRAFLAEGAAGAKALRLTGREQEMGTGREVVANHVAWAGPDLTGP